MFSRYEGRVHIGAMSSELVIVRVQYPLPCGMPPSGLASRVRQTTTQDERSQYLRVLVGHAAIKLLTGIAAPEPASRRSLARSRRCLRFPAQTKGVGSRFQPVTVCSSQLITSCAFLGC